MDAEQLVRRAYDEAWNRGDLDALTALGETVVVLFRFRAKGRDGLEVDAKFGQVGTLHDGLVTSITAYGDWSEAAEAAGVEL